MVLLGLGLICVASMIAALVVYVLNDRENLDASSLRRGCTSHKTATLSEGVTAYMDEGPRDATVLVIIHGLTIGSLAYESYHAPFIAAGYRVLSFDGYGRGFSDRVARNDLSIQHLSRQLEELLDHLKIQRAILYGASLGAAIAAVFAASNPERVIAAGFQCPLIETPPEPKLLIVKVTP